MQWNGICQTNIIYNCVKEKFCLEIAQDKGNGSKGIGKKFNAVNG